MKEGFTDQEMEIKQEMLLSLTIPNQPSQMFHAIQELDPAV